MIFGGRFVFFLFMGLFLTSCQTTTQKALVDLDKTLIHFKSLENHIEKSCLVETTLAAPTRARYQASFAPDAAPISGTKNFLWTLSGNNCEVRSISETPASWEENHQKIIKAAFCTLLMGFQVESPLRGVKWLELEKSFHDGVWTWQKPSSGISQVEIRWKPFQIAVTSDQGSQFTAEYLMGGSFPRMKSLQRTSASSGLRVDQIGFQDFSQGRVNSVYPRELEEFDLSILDENFKEFQLYGHVKILRCE